MLVANSGGAAGAGTEGSSSILSSLEACVPYKHGFMKPSRGNKRCCNVRSAHRSLDLGGESERVRPVSMQYHLAVGNHGIAERCPDQHRPPRMARYDFP